MNIDNLTIAQARQIAAMFGGATAEPSTPHIGKECIVRTYASGVFFGTVTAHSGRQVEIANARRLWRWHTKEGISLSDVAQTGIDASKSRICAEVPTQTVLDALEIIPTTAQAAGSIRNSPVASK